MLLKKRVFVIGGTGFLGFHTILEFLKNGWEATALGLPPVPLEGLLPAGVKVLIRDIESVADDEILDLLRGHTALVYAAGLDDRYTPKKPAYPKFYHANVELPVRILQLAKLAGIKQAVVFGSYFAYFHRLWPNMKLVERHPYIRSRVEQELAVTTLHGLNVGVLELPYIFGDPLGRKSLWAPLIKYIRTSPLVLYMRGGTACISAETVGKAAFGVINHSFNSACYPIGQENLTWTQMLVRLAQADGRAVKVATLPSWVIRLGMLGVLLVHKSQGRESGLNLRFFYALQTAETFLDPAPSRKLLGYDLDILDEAFRKTIEACRD